MKIKTKEMASLLISSMSAVAAVAVMFALRQPWLPTLCVGLGVFAFISVTARVIIRQYVAYK
ncbi:MAG: sensor histidine kinase, partial [Alistipes sp.]|nr:sensor histidine kinase [Alistipes sp.]